MNIKVNDQVSSFRRRLCQNDGQNDERISNLDIEEQQQSTSNNKKRRKILISSTNKKRRTVHFSDNFEFILYPSINNQHDDTKDEGAEEETIKSTSGARREEIWWSQYEIYQFHKQAKVQIKQRVLGNCLPQYLRDLTSLFQDCLSSRVSVEEIIEKPSSMRILDCSNIEARTSLRGLENRTLMFLIKFRKYHVKSVLNAQNHNGINNCSTREAVLSARSIRTSRISRIMARMMGHADSMEVFKMIEEEEEEAKVDRIF